MELKFAFAVNTTNRFKKSHFGDADKYLIYQVENDKLKLVAEEENLARDMDESNKHGSKKKGDTIIRQLKAKNICSLVSMQFGKNIKMINKHFIPIVIYEENPEQAIKIINKHLHWIQDEWDNKSTDYNLFTIKFGVLKSKID